MTGTLIRRTAVIVCAVLVICVAMVRQADAAAWVRAPAIPAAVVSTTAVWAVPSDQSNKSAVRRIRDGVETAPIEESEKNNANEVQEYYWMYEVLTILLFFAVSIFFLFYLYFNKKIKKTESRIREREARYLAVIETAHDGFFALDLDGRIREVNKAYVERSGYSRDELLSMHVFDLDVSETPADVAVRIEEAILYGNALFTSKHRTKDGEVWDVEVGASCSDVDGGRIFAFHRDISARKRDEAALRDSEAKFRRILENMPLIGVSLDAEGRIVFANDHFLKLTGWAAEEILGRDWFGIFIGEENADEIRAIHKANMQDPDIEPYSTFENEIRTRDGESLLVSWFNTIIKDEADNLTGVASIGVDITERTRAEDQIRRMNLRMALAARAAEIGFWDWDPSTGGLIWDDGMFRLFGIDPKDFDGSYDFWKRTVHPDDVDRAEENIGLAVQGDRRLETEFRIVRPNGEVRHIKAEGAIVRNEGGEATRVTGINYDVTDRRLAEEALKESEAAYRAAFRTSPDAININRLADGVYVDVNEGFTRLTGFTLDEVIGKTSEEIGIWADFTDRQKLVAGLMAGGMVENLEANFRCKDGTIILALMSASIIDVRGEPHILSITRDIRDLREAEEKLIQAQKMEVVGQLTGGIAHDFNNLLQIIEGNLELARMRLPGSDPNLDKILKGAVEAGRRGAKLTQQLLAFSRKQSLNPKTLELDRLIEGMAVILSRTLGEDIGIEIDLDSDTAPVFADENQLQNAILNLALNARAAMPNGGTLTISSANRHQAEAVEIEAGTLLPGWYVELAISDTGVGMTEETVEHAFEPFFTTKGVGEGSGLGLSMVYGFARQSGGDARLESRENAGTIARILLPAAERKGL